MHPAVITSRVARNEFEKIKSAHADILTGMGMQQSRNEALTQQKDQQKSADMQSQQTMKVEMDKAKMVNETTANKNAMDFNIRQSELDIKRAALSSV